MPEKGGLEVIRELKQDFPSVKIIAVSGSETHYLDTALQPGRPGNDRKTLLGKENDSFRTNQTS